MIMQYGETLEKPHCDARSDAKLTHSAEETRLRLIGLQVHFEGQTVETGKLLYKAYAESRDVTEVTSGAKLLRLMHPPALAAVKQLRETTETSLVGRQARQPWLWHLMAVDPEKLALIGLSCVLRGVMEGYAGLKTASVRSVAVAIATAVQDEIEHGRWVSEQAEEAENDPDSGGKLLKALQHRYPQLDRKVWARWRAKIKLVREERMDYILSVQFGSAVLHAVCEPNTKYVEIAEVGCGAGKRELRLGATQYTVDLVQDVTAIAEVARPPLRPMLCPPNPWVYEGNKASGGYIIHRAPLVRTAVAAHTGQLERPVSQVDLDALNAVQAVPWRINKRIFDVVEQARALGLKLPSLPEPDTTPIPERLKDDAWALLDPKERQAHTRARREAYDLQASTRGVAIAVRDRMDVAAKVAGFPAIYFPHSRDFRGRMYPIPSRGPHPQADDLGKALIEFARGKPLGETGLYWLCVHAANCAGQNKLSFDDRVAWAWQNLRDIQRIAAEPLAWSQLWVNADDPWQFLAVCSELAYAMVQEDLGASFVSHLAVPLDGSCNGLQHLSAMGLDAVGAAATNLSSSEVRHDIYEDVAVIVRQIVETDAAAGNELAMAWHGRVDRKVCKRSVMTTPYGVTARGIRRQLVTDGLVPHWQGQTGKEQAALSNYLGDCLGTALGTVIKASKGIMAWCQTAAMRLAEANQPLDWTTPSGSRVRQAYYEQTERRIVTLAGKLVVYEEQLDGTIMRKKAALAASPNIVHSFDAAHLALTVNGAVAEGITDLAMIHDSYGVHACDTLAFSHVLRREFVAIYKTDWLTKIRDDILAYAPHVALPPVPLRDDFEIDQVMHAPFFFS